MALQVHLVGSVGLDTVPEVFAATGKLLGTALKRVPDGEPGGRRMWVTWQYPLFRGSPFLQMEPSKLNFSGTAPMKLANGVKPEEVRFGELGYAREARASYQDFLAARSAGQLPAHVRFQVSLPTPLAVLVSQCVRDIVPLIEPAYEKAMLREVAEICAAIPHHDLCLQWDVAIEMVMWDGRAPFPPMPGMEKALRDRFARLAQAVPLDVELGIHLCYGDMDGKHTIEPLDMAKLAEMANLITEAAGRPLAYFHMPVPISRSDDAYFAPLVNFRRSPGTELYLGLVHAQDGVAGTEQRMATARKYVEDFGIASECGISRARTPEVVIEFLRVHAEAAGV